MATVKFWQEMTKASTVNGVDKMMLGKNETGEALYVDFDQVKEYLNITGIELEPLVGGDTSGTALVVAPGPSGEQRTAEVASGKYYDFGSGPQLADADTRWKAYWNGSSWSLKDMGALPEYHIDEDLTKNTLQTEVNFASYIGDGRILSDGKSDNSSDNKSIIKMPASNYAGMNLNIKNIEKLGANVHNIAFWNSLNTTSLVEEIAVSNYNKVVPSDTKYISVALKVNKGEDAGKIKMFVSNVVLKERVRAITNLTLESDSLAPGNTVPNAITPDNAVNLGQMRNYSVAKSEFGLKLGLSDIEVYGQTTRSFPNSAVTYIFNKLTNKRATVTNPIKLNALQAGNIVLAKYAITGSNAVRVAFQTVTLVLGINSVQLTPELQILESNEYLGYSCNTTSNFGRVGFLTDTNTTGFYVINSNLGTTPSAIGALFTNGIFAVEIEVIEDGSIMSRIQSVSKVSSEVQFPTIDSSVVQAFANKSTRNDNASLLRLNDGSLIASWGRFVGEVTDHSEAFLNIKRSMDNGRTWDEYSKIDKTGIGNYIPSFYRKVDGTILCVYLVKKAAVSGVPVSYIAQRVSTDEGLTWGVEVPLTDHLDDNYRTLAAHRIYRNSNGALFLPYNVLLSGTGNSISSVYEGRLLRSNDDGVTWSDTGVILGGVGNSLMETGIYKNLAGQLCYYARTLVGQVPIYISNDGGVTFTFLKNAFQAANSMSSIYKMRKRDLWIGVCNDVIGDGNDSPSRKNIQVYTSTNGIDFTLRNNVYTFDGEYYVFEPILYEDRYTDGVYCVYTRYYSSIFDLVFRRIKTELL